MTSINLRCIYPVAYTFRMSMDAACMRPEKTGGRKIMHIFIKNGRKICIMWFSCHFSKIVSVDCILPPIRACNVTTNPSCIFLYFQWVMMQYACWQAPIVFTQVTAPWTGYCTLPIVQAPGVVMVSSVAAPAISYFYRVLSLTLFCLIVKTRTSWCA